MTEKVMASFWPLHLKSWEKVTFRSACQKLKSSLKRIMAFYIGFTDSK